ncbi:hypothetical protein [Candidatus Stoquefichus massiliensis]|uniref:hypothetical protein n=1 Tax=Candidatus Stoquefichus massiliensis TaxID=1470350 RepID=UPI000489139F|nr:hypothetical protein [Candidatus Stoquefichus massiliensis]
MVIVLIAARYQTILSWLYQLEHDALTSLYTIKRNGPKVYLYVETKLSYQDIVRLFQQCIYQHGGINYVYQFYGIYHGMIDYNAYLSQETKDKMSYYLSNQKDISDKEINNFLKMRA